MKIDWMQLPSEFGYVHIGAHGKVVATSVPMKVYPHRSNIYFPENVLVSCTSEVTYVFEAGDEPCEQWVRPVMPGPIWDMLPEDVTVIVVQQGDVNFYDAATSDTVLETIRRMNLRDGRHVRITQGDGECIRMAVDVMRKQRVKGLEKYGQPLEANEGYTLSQMVRMAQEEMADGGVYLAKVQMMIGRIRDLASKGDMDGIKRELEE